MRESIDLKGGSIRADFNEHAGGKYLELVDWDYDKSVVLTPEATNDLANTLYAGNYGDAGLLYQIALRADLLVNRGEPGDREMLAGLIAEAKTKGLIPEIDPTEDIT